VGHKSVNQLDALFFLKKKKKKQTKQTKPKSLMLPPFFLSLIFFISHNRLYASHPHATPLFLPLTFRLSVSTLSSLLSLSSLQHQITGNIKPHTSTVSIIQISILDFLTIKNPRHLPSS
jgi:hypothetical protein